MHLNSRRDELCHYSSHNNHHNNQNIIIIKICCKILTTDMHSHALNTAMCGGERWNPLNNGSDISVSLVRSSECSSKMEQGSCQNTK